MRRTSGLRGVFAAAVAREDWLNADGAHMKPKTQTAKIAGYFTWPPPEPCASLARLPCVSLWLRRPWPETHGCEDHWEPVALLFATPLSLRPLFPGTPTSRREPYSQAQN